MASKYNTKRRFEVAQTGDEALGPLKLLPGTWKSTRNGWNMIALPFEQGPFKYRVLMNQYDETLSFEEVSDNVENRGLEGVVADPTSPAGSPTDSQFVVALDYVQDVVQQMAEDFPDSGGLADVPKKPIHHEPGLWLYMKNLRATDKDFIPPNIEDAVLEVARLATIPHGNSVLALGTVSTHDGMPAIPPISGLPIGRFENLGTGKYDVLEDDGNGKPDPYLEPYKHYIESPFMGDQTGTVDFPGFNPRDMNEILRFENKNVDIVRTTVLTVDSTRQNAGVVNIPFVIKQAEPVSLKSTFWIQELKKKDKDGYPLLRIQYSQIVMMDFFRPREDGHPSRAAWPHISINTLEKVSGSSKYSAAYKK